ncbi:MAG: hypothetical protein ACPGVP_09755 [Thiolinea sp.]
MHLTSTMPVNPGTLNCPTEKVAIDNHERVIFYRLGVNQVFYDAPQQLLYFSDLTETPVLSLLEQLCAKQQQRFVLELLFLDVKHYFFGGYRVRLHDKLTKPLLVALRLKGTKIKYELPRANINNPETPWFISKPVEY